MTTTKPIEADPIAPGLERSCADDWMIVAPHQSGIQRIEAYFSAHAYAPHRHDTYSIGYTITGVQSFHYRGARAHSVCDNVMVLHPDEIHDGQAGSSSGFHYRMLYIEPSLIRDALETSATALPFVKEAVLLNPQLLSALKAALGSMERVLEPIERDQLLLMLAENLLAQDQSAKRAHRAVAIDGRAIALARDYLSANIDRVVRSEELEQITHHDRYALARQFRAALGTSPYRYLTMRRLERARDAISSGVSLADAAALSGFSDQSHMTRQFRAAFGLSPGRWRQLQTHI